MSVRLVSVLICAAVLVASAPSLLAQPNTPLVCCADEFGCGSKLCCVFDPMDYPKCSDEATGYCMAVCIRPGGH